MAFLSVRNLQKEYRVQRRRKGLAGSFADLFAPGHTVHRALDGLSFDIQAGECVGYVGPNGAGKSTTIRILAGILYPTAGEVHVAGMVPWANREKFVRHVGMMFGNRCQLWPELSPHQSFDLLRGIYGVPRREYDDNLHYLTQQLGIQALLDRPIREMSLGQRMRCELASVFLHGPQVVFLDEPTIGLDHEAKRSMREIIRTINRDRGTTILYTSHDLREIEETCQRLIVIDRGHLLFDGTPQQMRQQYPTARTLRLTVPDGARRDTLAASLARNHGAQVAMDGDTLRVRFLPGELDVAAVLAEATAHGAVSDVVLAESDIEDTIGTLYAGGRS